MANGSLQSVRQYVRNNASVLLRLINMLSCGLPAFELSALGDVIPTCFMIKLPVPYFQQPRPISKILQPRLHLDLFQLFTGNKFFPSNQNRTLKAAWRYGLSVTFAVERLRV